jgi:hypothetical protein
MTTDAQRARIHAALDAIAAARTAGEAIDAVPADWGRMLLGPDTWGFHCSFRPSEAQSAVTGVYDRGHAMGRGDTQMDAIRDAVKWLRERIEAPTSDLAVLKDRAIALTLATDALNDLYVRLEAQGDAAQAGIVNEEVQRLAQRMDAAQFAILKHFGRGDGNAWDDSHPLNEALWTGQATPEQIREYA